MNRQQAHMKWDVDVGRSAGADVDMGQSVVRWRASNGEVLACDEKRAVLDQNIDDVRRALQDAMDEAVIVGCDEQQFRAVVRGIVESLASPYYVGIGGGRRKG